MRRGEGAGAKRKETGGAAIERGASGGRLKAKTADGWAVDAGAVELKAHAIGDCVHAERRGSASQARKEGGEKSGGLKGRTRQAERVGVKEREKEREKESSSREERPTVARLDGRRARGALTAYSAVALLTRGEATLKRTKTDDDGSSVVTSHGLSHDQRSPQTEKRETHRLT